MSKMLFINATGVMILYSSHIAEEYLEDEIKYTVVDLAQDEFDSSLIYYLEDGEVKTKSGDTAERRKGVEEAKKEQAKTQYQRDRIYATWQEQMDMQYWDQVNGTTTWKDAVAKVKSDNPKPE